jgi:hypothetical protein
LGAQHARADTAVGCSARALTAAINAANAASPATLLLDGGCVIKLKTVDNTTDGPTGLPVITGDVSIQGNGATIKRHHRADVPPFRIFAVAPGATLTLQSLNLGYGLLPRHELNGGGAIDNRGTLSVSDTTFFNNVDRSSEGAAGGAIQNSGALTVTRSTFTSNRAMEGGAVFNQNQATIEASTFNGNKATIYGGGALLNALGSMNVSGSTFVGNTGPGGGAVDNDATLSISDSTFFDNSAGTNGGGAIVNFGPATLTQTTLSANSAPYGANVYQCCGGTMTFAMSIVAGGVGGDNCGGTPVSDGGYNLDSTSTCGFSSGSGSMSDQDPGLGPPEDNGGPTKTMAPGQGSVAVDAIPASVPGCVGSDDQRGVLRPQGTACDIGAFEVEVSPPQGADARPL